MRLKQLEVHGFKTFANRTSFVYTEGITAIVGPNGCGKSNIADAIRWALGEQSPSALRTKKTEDLIFTGSATRPRMGMAEVALTLENPFSLVEQAGDEAASANFGGGNETEGDGANGHETRPRGNVVDEILRARPSEVTIVRRAYRSGENEYLINRQRVRLRDIFELLQRWGLARLTYAVIGQGLIDQALSLRAEERRSLFEEAAGIGLYQSKKQNALEKLEETQQNLLRVNDIINEIAPRLPSLARQADRAGKYESVATALSTNLRQWYAYQWAHAQESFIQEQTAENEARAALEIQRATMHDLGARLTDARRQAQGLRVKLGEHRRIRQEAENAQAGRERELAILEERARFAQQQHSDASGDLVAIMGEAALAAKAFEDSTARGLTVSTDDARADEGMTLGVDAPQAAEPELPDVPEAELQQLVDAAQVEAERLARSEQEADRATQNLTGAEEAAQQQHKAAAERLTETERAAESEHAAKASARAAELEDERTRLEHERARAIARTRLAEARREEFGEAPITLSVEPELHDARDFAAQLIALQERLPLYETALPAIAGLAARADDLAQNEKRAREHERILERVREDLNQSKTALALAERDVQAARKAEAEARREHERAASERAREYQRARERVQQELERAREKIARERERLTQERAQLKAERDRLASDRHREQERLILERQRERERLGRERERERERLAREQERERERAVRERTQEHERIAREHERTTRELQLRQERVATFAAQIGALAAQLLTMRQEVEGKRVELDTLTADAFPDEAALNESEQLQNELEEQEATIRSGLTTAEELHNRAVLDAERRRAEIARLEQEIEDDLGPVELDSNAPRQLRLRLVVQSPRTAAGASEEVDAAGEGTTLPEEAAQELVTLPEVAFLPDGFDKEIRRLKNQMRYIGNVNPNAPQEYSELKERHAFLTEQAADLTQAIERLHQAIHELDEMMKSRFKETFDAINVEFKKYFSILFGGGAGRLELTDPADLIHSGIEISARPPGKRAAQLVLLSGGERALTAAALLFAILKVSPTPFCVLDEVDAALDEANVGRFRDGLRDLTAGSQFIVITHNRLTMEAANRIYGVSMGEDGVSQVLSLKLEEAVANAA